MWGEADYHQPLGLNIGEAMAQLKDGAMMSRRSWAREMRRGLVLMADGSIWVETATGRVQYTPTHADLLARDWYVVE